MNGNSDALRVVPNIPLRQYLFNPFRILAGLKALLLGLVVILITGFIGSVGNTHFDGVLDVHMGADAPAWALVVEGVIDWLCMVLMLSFSALLVARSRWRFIDILGTQALSRWPTLVTALVMLPDANRRFVEHLMSRLGQGNDAVTIDPLDAVIFFAAAIIALLMIIWMVALMYRAYAVSCNLRGARAVVTFIVSIILAEALSKVLIIALLAGSLGTNTAMADLLGRPGQNAPVVSGFENDPQLVGTWQSVDFVSDVNNFQPGAKRWKGEPFLNPAGGKYICGSADRSYQGGESHNIAVRSGKTTRWRTEKTVVRGITAPTPTRRPHTTV